MNISRSITKKLILIIAAAFFLSLGSTIIIADLKLVRIIDKNQNNNYSERIRVIESILEHYYNKLQETGQPETLAEDYKTMAIKEIQHTYYTKGDLDIYPFILDRDTRIILHPKLSGVFPDIKYYKIREDMLNNKRGQFTADFSGTKSWYIYDWFGPWEWYVCYTVPVHLKYSNVYKLRNMLILVMSVIIISVLIILSLFITRLTKPIVTLTGVAKEIADGNFDIKMDISGNDEISILAQSFDRMRKVIKEKIDDLNDKNEKLKASESRFRALVENTSDWIWEVDKNNIFTYVSPEIEKSLGYKPEEVIGESVYKILSTENISKMKKHFQDLIKTGKPIIMEENINRHKDGHMVYAETTGIPIRDSNGVITGYRGMDRDITKRKKIEMEREELQERLNHKDRLDAIGQLAGGIAHDFNNMLAGIMGAAQLLQSSKKDLGEKNSGYVDMILTASARAAELTDKLLTFSRKGTIGSTVVDVHKIINDTIDILGKTLDKKISITVKKEAKNHLVIGDNSNLQNAFLNLGINASHAMEEGGDLIIITRDLFLNSSYCSISPFDIEPGDYIEIEVRDTGCGISPENLKRIFEPYFTTKETEKGTGMGLASVYGTVLNHHGAIDVYSEENRGTVFHIYLPCSKETETESISDQPRITASGNILLVDDEEIIRTTGKLLLEEMGYTVILAENGVEAVNIFKEKFKDIDLVIMDMIMPKMNGKEAFMEMKSIDKDCRILLSSGFTKDEDLKSLEKEGLTGFIHKPYKIHELHETLSSILK